MHQPERAQAVRQSRQRLTGTRVREAPALHVDQGIDHLKVVLDAVIDLSEQQVALGHQLLQLAGPLFDPLFERGLQLTKFRGRLLVQLHFAMEARDVCPDDSDAAVRHSALIDLEPSSVRQLTGNMVSASFTYTEGKPFLFPPDRLRDLAVGYAGANQVEPRHAMLNVAADRPTHFRVTLH